MEEKQKNQENEKEQPKEVRKTSIGGQALLGGIMMKSPQGISMAVRKQNGEISHGYDDYIPWSMRHPLLKLPIIRGCVGFAESLSVGMKTMTRAAELLEIPGEEEETPSKFEIWLDKKFGKNIEKVVMAISSVIAVGISVLLFIALPSLIASLLKPLLPALWMRNVAEGITRLVIFFGYLVGISFIGEIKKTFQFHGAEHKTIACYEHDLPLTIENAQKQKRLHPRCGTNYLFLVMMVSILFFSLIGFDGHWAIKIAMRVVLLPLVAGLSYEVLRFAGMYDNALTRIIRFPGMQLQKITTSEPTDEQVEVAIQAFEWALDSKAAQEKYGDPDFSVMISEEDQKQESNS